MVPRNSAVEKGGAARRRKSGRSIDCEELARLIKPRGLHVEQDTLTDTYGKFVAEPLERGSASPWQRAPPRAPQLAPGAAMTSRRIEGVEHEFTTISNVAEDVTTSSSTSRRSSSACTPRRRRPSASRSRGPRK